MQNFQAVMNIEKLKMHMICIQRYLTFTYFDKIKALKSFFTVILSLFSLFYINPFELKHILQISNSIFNACSAEVSGKLTWLRLPSDGLSVRLSVCTSVGLNNQWSVVVITHTGRYG